MTRAAIALNDLSTSSREPRVYDLLLAERLGFEHSRNIRKLIKSHRGELERYGELVAVADRTGGAGHLLQPGANPKAGRPGMAFYLNEGQAVLVCILSRTLTAATVRHELILVFAIYRRRHSGFDLRQAERRALQAIVENADVVLAPNCYPASYYSGGCYHDSLVKPVGCTEDGSIPFLLAPITFSMLDALSEFEANKADLEDSSDAEATNEDGGDINDQPHDDEGDDYEDGGDAENSLGSLMSGNQEDWAAGKNEDVELVNEDGGDIQDERHGDVGSEDGPCFPNVLRCLNAEADAAANATRRLGAIVERLTGVPAGSAVRS